MRYHITTMGHTQIQSKQTVEVRWKKGQIKYKKSNIPTNLLIKKRGGLLGWPFLFI